MISKTYKLNYLHKIIFFLLFILSFFICDAQKLTQQNGLNTIEFKTPEGTIYTYLPNKFVINQQISGTVISQPNGSSEKQLKKNLKKLSSYILQIGTSSTTIANPVFSLIMNEENSIPLQLKDPKGNIIATQQVLLENVVGASQISFPKTLVSENRSQIYGDFDGNLLTTNLKVGGKLLSILAESPVQTLFQSPLLEVAPTELVLIENGKEYTSPIQIIGMEFTADKLKLKKGEGTNIHITIKGLNTVKETVDFVLDNVSVPVITLQGGNHQELIFYPGEQEAFSKSWRIQSLKSGGFNLIAKLTVPDTPFLTKVKDPEKPILVEDDTIDISNCKEGTWRYKTSTSTKTCVWLLPTSPKINITSASEHGKYAVPGAEDFLGNLSKIFGAIDDLMNLNLLQAATDLAGIPTSPMGYASSITGIGGKATKAAARWGRENAKKLLNISAKITMQQITVKCAPIEICKDGVWIDAGLWPIGKPTIVNLNTISYTDPLNRNKSFSGKQLAGQMRMIMNWYKTKAKGLDEYIKNPCNCKLEETTTTIDKPKTIIKPKKKSCEPIREKIGKTKEGIAYGESQIKKFKADIEAKTKELEQQKIDWEKSKATANLKIKEAKKEVKLANDAWDRLLANAGSYTKTLYEKRGKEIIERQSKANANLKTAENELKSLNKKFQYDITTLEAIIELNKKTIAEFQGIIDTQKKELIILEGQLKDCLRTGGI